MLAKNTRKLFQRQRWGLHFSEVQRAALMGFPERQDTFSVELGWGGAWGGGGGGVSDEYALRASLSGRKDVVNQCLEFGMNTDAHSEHRFPAPSSKAGCRKPVPPV